MKYEKNIFEFQIIRDPITGEIVGLEEVSIPVEDDDDCLSMARAPLPPSLATRGTTTQNPFLPAGFEEELQKMLDEAAKSGEININLEDDEPGKFLGEGTLFCDFKIKCTFCNVLRWYIAGIVPLV